MRVEGISEGSASQLTGNAFEQHAPVRVPDHRGVRPAQVVPNVDVRPEAVVDVHDSSPAATTRQEVEFKVPQRIVRIGTEEPGVIDRNGDGMITLSDLPFDYFQILRQSNRKLITPPSTDIPF